MDDEVGAEFHRALWARAAAQLKTELSDAIWNTCFVDARVLPATTRSNAAILALCVPNSLVRERITSRYLGHVKSIVSDLAGTSITVEVIVDPLANSEDLTRSAGRSDPSADEEDLELDEPDAFLPTDHDLDAVSLLASGGVSPLASGAATSAPGSIQPRYTFDDFVTGQSNQFAKAAAQKVAEQPARAYNPLFIYGESGLGKTHLLQAIAHYVGKYHSANRVRYVSTETFVNEFVDAIRNNASFAFKRRYRDECDVLLIDDIQFIEGKEATQEEFFYTFDYLHKAGRQIVISSDRPPKAISTLEDRLRTRFEWGLITDVQPPELETRLAILRQKAMHEQSAVPDEVLTYIATHVKENIRQLEGALNRVCAYAGLNRETLTLPMAQRVLADILSGNEPRPITAKAILDATSEMFGFSIADLTGQSRRRPLVIARQIGMYVFRELTDHSYPTIGREFGGRDHTTVIHAVEKITNQMKERRAVYDQVGELIRQIRQGSGGKASG